MTVMHIVESENWALAYDTEDVESYAFSVPADVIELPAQPGDTFVRRELGQNHLTLNIDFKPGKRAQLIKVRES